MLIELVGHNDAPVSVNPNTVKMITAGTTLGTTHIYHVGDPEPVVVQGFRADVARLFMREGVA
jgi:hypothetical protein